MQGKLTVYTEKSAAVLVNCRTFVILFLKETGLVGQAALPIFRRWAAFSSVSASVMAILRMMFRTVASRQSPPDSRQGR